MQTCEQLHQRFKNNSLELLKIIGLNNSLHQQNQEEVRINYQKKTNQLIHLRNNLIKNLIVTFKNNKLKLEELVFKKITSNLNPQINQLMKSTNFLTQILLQYYQLIKI